MRTWIDPVDREALVGAMARALVGGALLLVEGDFQDGAFDAVERFAIDTPQGLKRESPESSDVLAFRLEEETVEEILATLLEGDVIHSQLDALQIQKAGVVEFMVGDAFDRECVSVGPGVDRDLLRSLVDGGVIKWEIKRPGPHNAV